MSSSVRLPLPVPLPRSLVHRVLRITIVGIALACVAILAVGLVS